MPSFIFRIYGSEYSWANHDESICHVPEDQVHHWDFVHETRSGYLGDLKEAIDIGMDIYTGATYCIKDASNDAVIICGQLGDVSWETIREKLTALGAEP